MAITLYAQPDVVCSANSDVVFDVVTDSTDITTLIKATLFYKTSQENFYRIAGRKSSGKRSGYNYHRFNFTGLLNKLLSHDYQEGLTGIYTDCSHSSIEFFVKFTEYYPIPTPTAHASTSSGLFYANNTNILKTETQGTYTGSDWYMDGVASHKFLTNSPNLLPIREGERVQLGFLTSYTDPIVKVTKTQYNGASATTTYQIGNQTYEIKLWDWSVDEDNVVTIETPELYTGTTYIEALSGTSAYKYMADDSQVMWGGVNLIGLNDVVDIVLPVLTAASADINLHVKAVTSACDFEVYYYYSAAWNLSGSGTQTAATASFSTFNETLPAGTTKVRIKKLEANTNHLYIAWGSVEFIDNNAQNKRCQFTLGTGEITSAIRYLDIFVENGSGGVISETKRFEVDRELIDQSSRFAFKNLRGEFDHYTFKQGHQESLTVEKVITQKELPVGFTKADRQSQVAFVTSDIIFTSWTEYEENTTLTWLKELVESKEVYLIVNDVRYAIDILTSGVKHSHHTEPLQFEINWAFSAKRNV